MLALWFAHLVGYVVGSLAILLALEFVLWVLSLAVLTITIRNQSDRTRFLYVQKEVTRVLLCMLIFFGAARIYYDAFQVSDTDLTAMATVTMTIAVLVIVKTVYSACLGIVDESERLLRSRRTEQSSVPEPL